jgi:hypothetical protein
MKDAGITIYAVGYGLNANQNTAAKKLWQDCASDANKQFTAQGVDDLIQTFKDIATSAVGSASVITPALVE